MKCRKSFPASRRGASGFSGLAFIVIVVGGVALMVMRSRASRDEDTSNLSVDRIVASDTIRAPGPAVEAAVGAFRVRDTSGAIIPLMKKGEPAILMISSVTCGWCKQSLKDLGAMSAGRPLPRLKLLTLEGAADGAPMLARENITGAQLIGPSGSRDQVMLTFRYPGTPTFVAIDSEGRVVATRPGYPPRSVMERLFAVMVGDAALP